MKIKLSITQNAFHSLYHAIEHLALASKVRETGDRTFDDDTHTVVVTRDDGRESFTGGTHYTKTPAYYNYKFAILHLIQAMELLIKGYLHGIEPALIFETSDRKKTISLNKALRELLKRQPDLLTPDQVALIYQAKNVRNFVEHYQFCYSVSAAQAMAHDFLAVCNYLAYRLFNVSLVEEFSYDPLTEGYDSTGDLMTELLSSLGQAGIEAANKMALLWQLDNLEDKLFICFQCGSRAASSKKGACIVCGADTEEEMGKLVDELEATGKALVAMKKQLGRI